MKALFELNNALQRVSLINNNHIYSKGQWIKSRNEDFIFPELEKVLKMIKSHYCGSLIDWLSPITFSNISISGYEWIILMAAINFWDTTVKIIEFLVKVIIYQLVNWQEINTDKRWHIELVLEFLFIIIFISCQFNIST